MSGGPSILHLLDQHASARETGTLHHADATAISRAARAAMPQCRHDTFVLPGRSLGAAALALRRVDRPTEGSRAPRGTGDGRSLLHCYSWRAAHAARLAFGRTRPILLSTGEESEEPRSLLGISAPDAILHHGVDPGRDVVPLASAKRLASSERADLRRALGVGEREFVVGAVAEPGLATNARWLVFFAGILVAGGLDLTIMIPRGAGQVDRMRRFHATTRLNLRVILVEEGCEVDPGPDASAWHACDVAVLRPDLWAGPRGDERAARTIRRSHLSGVPVITPLSLARESLYPERIADHLVVSAGTTKQVARALTALIEDRGLLESVRQGAEEAARKAGSDGLAAVLREAYRPATRGLLSGPYRAGATG